MTKFKCIVNQLNKRLETCPRLSEPHFSLCACCCHLKTLLDKLAACPYNSIVMSFCSRTKNTITCFCWANVHASDYDPVVETFFIDYQDNERGDDRLCFCFIVFVCFIFGSFVPTFVNAASLRNNYNFLYCALRRDNKCIYQIYFTVNQNLFASL